MQHGSSFTDYEPVTPPRRSRLPAGEDVGKIEEQASDEEIFSSQRVQPQTEKKTESPGAHREAAWLLKHGHTFTFIGLFLFTVVLYFRPYDFYPAVVPSNTAFIIGLATLCFFLPSQIILEGTLTARPREVNLVLLLCLGALLSIPLAINRTEALATFSDTFIKAVVMFIMMVNVARTEFRLRLLLWLALAVSLFLAVNALNDYRLSKFAVEGYRVEGALGGMFRNPNDMAIHLVSIVPIAVALFFSKRNIFMKSLYAAIVVIMIGGIVVTFSRGAFLGLAVCLFTMTWKMGKRNRFAIVALFVCFLIAFAVLAPSSYFDRMSTIGDPRSDPNGSALARRAVLFRSISVAAHNPLFGVGIGNFHIVSIKELVTHNAYTQVAAEMGLAAMVVYVLFIVTPLKRLREIERETFSSRRGSKFYYLAIGLQGSLIGFMVSSFFGAVAYQYNVYYLVGYAVCLRRIYAASSDAQLLSAASAEKNEGGATEVGASAQAARSLVSVAAPRLEGY